MQTLTFTQKLLRQRRFLSSLIPLLALFLGLGASQKALAQAPFGTTRSVVVDGTTYNTELNNTTGNPAPAGEFDERDFGSFNINTGQLNLNGGTFTITETGGNTYSSGFLDFRIFRGNTGTTTTPATGTPDPVTVSSIQLTNQGLSAGNVRTFSLTTAAQNLINLSALVPEAGTFRFDVQYRALGSDGDPTTTTSSNRRSQFTVTGTRTPPTGFVSTQVLLDIDGIDPKTNNTTYDASAVTAAPNFQGAQLGTFDINTGQLYLNGGIVNTSESSGDVVSNVTLNYRIFKNGQSPRPGFIAVPLQPISSSNGARQFSLTNAQVNAIDNLANLGNGTFNIQVYYQCDVDNAANNTSITLIDNNAGANYTAQFTTTGIPIQTITWNGTINDDWFNPGNWNLGRVPDEITNVIIPNFAAGVLSPYPNIYSGSSFTASNGLAVNNTALGPALARNLFLTGISSTTDRSILRLQSGTLRILGNFSNRFLSYIARDNTNTEFAGISPQKIDQGSYATLTVSGGGTKSIVGTVIVNEQFVFNSTNGNTIVTTDPLNPGVSYIQLADRLTQNSSNGAQLVGENNSSYIRGLIATRRNNVFANELDGQGNPTVRTYGGIGLTTYFTGTDNPGDIEVTRSTEDNYFLMGDRLSVRRVFGVRPSNQITSQGRLRANMTFTVLPNETTDLRPSNGSILQQNLSLFLSTTNGNSFGNLGRDAIPENYTVIKSGVRNFATFTLGDNEKPLPVNLTKFDAKRVGTDVLVTWETASEQNSKGYDVQVSTTGKEFRTLASVASVTPNSTGITQYRFIDIEKNKTGARYYRLRQVDLDGKETFFNPVAVSFTGKATETALIAYPNPLNGNEQLHLTFQSAKAGKGQISITDMTGRMVRQQPIDVTTGTSDLTVEKLGDLKMGMYLVRLTLPSGQVQNLKVVKQ